MLHILLCWLEKNVRLPLEGTAFDTYLALPLKHKYKNYRRLYWHNKNKLFWVNEIPLQFMSTSAPKTCKRKHETVSTWVQETINNFNYTERIPDVMKRLFLPFNISRLTTLCHLSLAHIVQDFNLDPNCSYISTIRSNLETRTNHVYMLSIFFLLLNVDLKLKSFLLNTDKTNHAKMVRFFVDLRNNSVVCYLHETSTSNTVFLENCKEAWLLA